MIETLGQRIKERRKALKLTQMDLSRRMQGVSHAAISQWENDTTKPNAENLLDLSTILNCEFGWLLRGSPNSSKSLSVIPYSPIDEMKLPIYDWQSLDKLKECDTTQLVDLTREYIMADFKKSKNAFGLKIKDDSMSPEFKIGDVIIIDPDVEPQAGEFVIAKYGDEFIFRKFKLDNDNSMESNNFILIPLNDDYGRLHSINVDLLIIGTMVEHRIYRRKR